MGFSSMEPLDGNVPLIGPEKEHILISELLCDETKEMLALMTNLLLCSRYISVRRVSRDESGHALDLLTDQK